MTVLNDVDDGLEAELVLLVACDWGGDHFSSVWAIPWEGDTDDPPTTIQLPLPINYETSHHECNSAAAPNVRVKLAEIDLDDFQLLMGRILIIGGATYLGARITKNPVAITTAFTVGKFVADDLFKAIGQTDSLQAGADFIVSAPTLTVQSWNSPGCDPAYDATAERRDEVGRFDVMRRVTLESLPSLESNTLRFGISDTHPVGRDAAHANERLRIHRDGMQILSSASAAEGSSTDTETFREALQQFGVGLASRIARDELAEAMELGLDVSTASALIAAAESDSAAGNYLAATDKFDQAILLLLKMNHPEYNRRHSVQARGSQLGQTLSGSPVAARHASTKTYYMYPDACAERASGVWSPRGVPQADSLDTYPVAGPLPFVTGTATMTGALWSVDTGTESPTNDPCHSEKSLFANRLISQGDDPTGVLIVSDTWVESCTFAIPSGTGWVTASANLSSDFPRYSGLSFTFEYRVFRTGQWSDWLRTSEPTGDPLEPYGQWNELRRRLPLAPLADSVQIRYVGICDPSRTTDGQPCPGIIYRLLLDDLLLEVETGLPLPEVSLSPWGMAQSTFVDGTMLGANCTTMPCWPGPRGSDLASSPNPVLASRAIDDNFNSPSGDEITLFATSPLADDGPMGINWHRGYDRGVDEGRTLCHSNASHNPSFDTPRMIYRIFDPATQGWSPWDSTELFADDVAAASMDTLVVSQLFRTDWPPQDKLDAAAVLPGGFTVNGTASYSGLRYLPRGTKLQYYFKVVDLVGQASYAFSTTAGPGLETVDRPLLPGGSILAPDILQFEVLPGRYPPGPSGSLLADRTDTPLLSIDAGYTGYSSGVDPLTRALHGLGVRADRYRLLPGIGEGQSIGGHERAGQAVERFSNHFPNMDEYPIAESLATWYRLVIATSHELAYSTLEEQDAALLETWARSDTGPNGGDRCLLASGDDFFYALTDQISPGIDATARRSLSTNVFGVAGAATTWGSPGGNAAPTIDDRFAAQTSGPALAGPLTFTYPIDGACPRWDLFDALTPGGAGVVTAVYPGAAPGAVGASSDFDVVGDLDRTKALGYGFSLGQVRLPGLPPGGANYLRSGFQEQMRILHKFLTSCRGPRTAEPSTCWPCPTDPLMNGEWAAQSGYQTSTYGPLYPIQAQGLITASPEQTPSPPAHVNALSQNRPNPFNPHTRISFSLASPGTVELRVFDVAGRLVRTLVHTELAAGRQEVTWDGVSDRGVRLASGVYFYRIVYPDGSASSRSLVLLR